jgi:hypothetical protein
MQVFVAADELEKTPSGEAKVMDRMFAAMRNMDHTISAIQRFSLALWL